MSGPSDCLAELTSQQAARHELLCLLKIAFHVVLSIRYVDECLDVAAKTPTKARYIAARSIIKQIEKQWYITKGELPSASWEEASKSPEKPEQYRKVVRAWQQWASENIRFSSQFFDRDGWVKEPSQ
jgi:hypothetical protein